MMCHGFERGADVGCAVQLHTEDAEDFEAVARLPKTCYRTQVVKHYSGGRRPRTGQLGRADKDELEIAVEPTTRS